MPQSCRTVACCSLAASRDGGGRRRRAHNHPLLAGAMQLTGSATGWPPFSTASSSSFRRCRCRAAAAAAAGSSDGVLPALAAWLAERGGFVHPHLALVQAAPSSGCRGVVAAAAIPLQQLEEHGPLVVVPQQLAYSTDAALRLITRRCGRAAAAAAQAQLSHTQLLAAALAAELRQLRGGGGSGGSGGSDEGDDWRPYLASLPALPPNPWLLDDVDAVAALIAATGGSRGGHATAGWAEAVAARRAEMAAAADAAVALLGSGLDVPAGDMLVALGHVASRALTSSSGSGLVPVLDLLNHAGDARPPMLQLNDADALVMTVLPIRNDEAVPLEPGQELLIAYRGGYTPVEAFLKFGFVADEWW